MFKATLLIICGACLLPRRPLTIVLFMILIFTLASTLLLLSRAVLSSNPFDIYSLRRLTTGLASSEAPANVAPQGVGAPVSVFPVTDPSQPPAVDSPVVPDFGTAWATAYHNAQAKIANWDLKEKVSAVTGVGWMNGRCVGNIPAIEPQDGKGWPGLCLEDSPNGVRFADYVTAFPSGINTAATFNRKLIRQRGLFVGLEHRAKGVNVVLGPMMNMARVAEAGRNWEGFGGDPFLAGEASYETILGLQQAGVQACAKHLIGNEQEHLRLVSSSEIDDRTMHEVYAHPFLKSVMAGVVSVMCGYNKLNDTYACENDKILNDILKREFGFQGYVVSDWCAQHSTLSAIKGLDMLMPGDIDYGSGTTYWGNTLVEFVQNGAIPLARIDDMVTRIVAGWYFVHQQDGFPKTNFDAFHPEDESTNARVDAQGMGDADTGDGIWHAALVREIGAASTVLLKNVRRALPLRRGDAKRGNSVALIGSDAGPARIGPNRFVNRGGVDGVLAMGWGSGTAEFPYLISPLEAIQARARKERSTVSWNLDDFDLEGAARLARGKTVAIVFVQSDSGEEMVIVDGNEGDRRNLTAWHEGDQLILAVAAQNDNTIVVVHSAGALIVEPWIDHPNITAVLWAGLPGQEAGNALADVLYGDWNPSGRLPYTIAKRPEDYPAHVNLGSLTIPYTEGLEIDYRHFDANHIEPRFEFGFGLSYTTFQYSSMSIEKLTHADDTWKELEATWDAGQPTAMADGSSAALWLHRPAYEVSFNVQNTGDTFGGDVPQVYLHQPPSAGSPPSLLRGFTHVELAPGETTRVRITLSRYDLSVWDTDAQGWRRPAGQARVSVRRSSRDMQFVGPIPP